MTFSMHDQGDELHARQHDGNGRYPHALFALWFGQFQLLAWLSTVAAGGAFALLQGDFVQFRFGAALAIGFFSLAALLGVLGPMRLDAGLLGEQDVRKSVRRTLSFSTLCFGMGIGALAMGMLLPLLFS